MSRPGVKKSPAGDKASNALDDMRPKADAAAALLSALANSKRLLVLCSLVDHPRSVGELAQIAGLSDAAVSQHLGKLRALGIVATRREAQTIFYSLASTDARAILDTLYGLFCAPAKKS
jgi:DNA-binding transcriptional ArsR family regulator